MPVPLYGFEFVALSLAAIALSAVLRGPARQIAFLSVNLLFLAGLLLGIRGATVAVSFTLIGYGLVLLSRRRPDRLWLAIGMYTVAFVYMRSYDFLPWILPDGLLTRALAIVGLSFLLFRVLHVMIDAASGTIEGLDFLTYLNYCLAFTTYTMGPIQRYQDYVAQWSGAKEAIPREFEAHLDAVLRVLLGLVKAYVLGAWFQERALRPDTDLLALSPAGLIVRTYSFWFFLYLNFSGYCDVVIGIGSLLGVRPPENFDKPFIARNISDFWLRQHRSLTLWLTDYVFTPCYKKALSHRITGRYPVGMANLCLMFTMLVSGLWHGTTLAFFLFGVVHGLWFVVYRTWDTLLIRARGRKRVRELRAKWSWHLAGIFLTFNATAFAFIFFQVRTERLLEVWRWLIAL
jgi:D-alanyl-lipoteichoic acid acyltransferase DltB (MBOAT superfamily)